MPDTQPETLPGRVCHRGDDVRMSEALVVESGAGKL